MRKSIIVLTMLFLLVTTISCAQEKVKDVAPAGIQWIEDYDEALQQANAEDKVVLINFTGSDWCSWCIKLDKEVFSKQEFAEYANKELVLLKLDFPTTFRQLPEEVQARRSELQQKYGVKGYPTILLTDANGNVVGQTGYQDGGPVKYVAHLKDMINKNKK